jgi:hypothetical protein
MKSVNASGEKEMRIHMKTVKGARKKLQSQAIGLARDIVKKMTFALSQDEKIMKDMRRADKK